MLITSLVFALQTNLFTNLTFNQMVIVVMMVIIIKVMMILVMAVMMMVMRVATVVMIMIIGVIVVMVMIVVVMMLVMMVVVMMMVMMMMVVMMVVMMMMVILIMVIIQALYRTMSTGCSEPETAREQAKYGRHNSFFLQFLYSDVSMTTTVKLVHQQQWHTNSIILLYYAFKLLHLYVDSRGTLFNASTNSRCFA